MMGLGTAPTKRNRLSLVVCRGQRNCPAVRESEGRCACRAATPFVIQIVDYIRRFFVCRARVFVLAFFTSSFLLSFFLLGGPSSMEGWGGGVPAACTDFTCRWGGEEGRTRRSAPRGALVFFILLLESRHRVERGISVHSTGRDPLNVVSSFV